MPTQVDNRSKNYARDSLQTAVFQGLLDAIREDIRAIIEVGSAPDLVKSLKSLKRGQMPNTKARLMTVEEGVLEESDDGSYCGAFQTDQGPVVLQDAKRTDRPSDPQLIRADTRTDVDVHSESDELTPDGLLRRLAESGLDTPTNLLCLVELARFDARQKQELMPLLWGFVLHHRDSNNQDRLVGVAAAIRKYVALMPMDRMGELALLLEAGHKSPLPIDLEIEVAKMIYRNFEVFPPAELDPHPELAERLWERAQAYTNSLILLRDKYAAAASLAIEALVAMRSRLAVDAWRLAVSSPYRWFGELVSDDLDALREKWVAKDSNAAAWLDELRSHEPAKA